MYTISGEILLKCLWPSWNFNSLTLWNPLSMFGLIYRGERVYLPWNPLPTSLQTVLRLRLTAHVYVLLIAVVVALSSTEY